MSAYSVRGRLVLGTELVPGAVVVEEGAIADVLRDPRDGNLPTPILEADIVSPGLIDLQVNGGFGEEIGGDPSSYRRLAALLPQTGVTCFLPTVVTASPESYRQAYEAFDAARGAPGARMAGLHLEGPFLSPHRIGAHRGELVESASPSLIDQLLEGDALRVMTLAPERRGALELIRRLQGRDVVVSLGHTDATCEEFTRGVDAGATMATHLYNAMSPFAHRAPGAIGAALIDDRVTVGLIPDGIHSHPASLRLAIRCKGTDRIALVTDMMSAAGMPPGAYQLGGQRVTVNETSARIENDSLAGSILTLDTALRNIVRWTEVTPAAAIHMMTEVPARVLGLSRTGRLATGYDADLTLFGAGLSVQWTVIGGKVMERRKEVMAS